MSKIRKVIQDLGSDNYHDFQDRLQDLAVDILSAAFRQMVTDDLRFDSETLSRSIEASLRREWERAVDLAVVGNNGRGWKHLCHQREEELENRIATLKRKLKDIRAAIRRFDQAVKTICVEHQMPDVPMPVENVTNSFVGPKVAGIYFLWLDEVVLYVGQSESIGDRVSTKHTVVKQIRTYERRQLKVSWLQFPVRDLDFAECFYIGVLRPQCNFGSNAKWTR